MHPSYCDGYSRLNTKRQALKEERHQQSHRRGPFFNVPFIAFHPPKPGVLPHRYPRGASLPKPPTWNFAPVKMPVSEAETIPALRVLLNSSNEILQAHRDLALQTLEQVRTVLAVKSHNNNTTSSNIQAEPLPFCNHKNLESHSSRQLGESSYSPVSVFEDRSHAAADATELPRTAEIKRNRDADPKALDELRSHRKSTLAQVNVRKRKRGPAREA